MLKYDHISDHFSRNSNLGIFGGGDGGGNSALALDNFKKHIQVYKIK